MNPTLRKALPGLALACLATAARADDDDSYWKFSGFGTLGAVVTDTDDAQFRANPRQPRGADRRPDLGVDSRLGLQANAALDETFSAVGQLLASRRDGDQHVQVEWLFAQASVTSWLDLRAGRMVLPVFLVSDSRNVGYTSHWARAPGDVYGIYPITSHDGAQVETRWDLAGLHFTLQASAGRSNGRGFIFGSSVKARFDRLRSLNLIAERGDWTLRVGQSVANARLDDPQSGLHAYLDRFSGLGMTRDDGKLLLQAEFVTRRTSDDGLDSNNGYLTAGYRFGPWMPYATVSRMIHLGQRFAGRPDEGNYAGGLRWDAWRNTAVKAQLESAPANEFNFVRGNAAFAAGHGRATVFTMLVDFVF